MHPSACARSSRAIAAATAREVPRARAGRRGAGSAPANGHMPVVRAACGANEASVPLLLWGCLHSEARMSHTAIAASGAEGVPALGGGGCRGAAVLHAIAGDRPSRAKSNGGWHPTAYFLPSYPRAVCGAARAQCGEAAPMLYPLGARAQSRRRELCALRARCAGQRCASRCCGRVPTRHPARSCSSASCVHARAGCKCWSSSSPAPAAPRVAAVHLLQSATSRRHLRTTAYLPPRPPRALHRLLLCKQMWMTQAPRFLQSQRTKCRAQAWIHSPLQRRCRHCRR